MSTNHAGELLRYGDTDRILALKLAARAGLEAALAIAHEFPDGADPDDFIGRLRRFAAGLDWEIDQARKATGRRVQPGAGLRLVR